MCCSMTQLSVNFIKTCAMPEQWGEACVDKFVAKVAQAPGSSVRSLLGHHLCPRAHPLSQRSRPTIKAPSGRNVSVSPNARTPFGRQHNTPGHSLHQLRWWEVRFSPQLVWSLHIAS